MGKHYRKPVAGYGEAGAAGTALKKELLKTARRCNIRLNCLCIMRR